MAMLIDANDVYSLFDKRGFAKLHVADIDTIPRVDAVEVVHGRWIQDKQSKFEHRYNCSACNYRLIDEHCNYCPNCGAKMDLEV